MSEFNYRNKSRTKVSQTLTKYNKERSGEFKSRTDYLGSNGLFRESNGLTSGKAEIIAYIVREILLNRQFSDRIFEEVFRNNQIFTPSDKAFISEWVYYVIRHWRLLCEIRNRILPSASTPQEFELLGIGWVLSGGSLSELPALKYLRGKDVRKAHFELKTNRPVFYSVPDWIDDIGAESFHEQWPLILESLNKVPKRVIRCNPLKIKPALLRQQLSARGIDIDIHPEAPLALIVNNDVNVFALPEFKEGLFEMQDVSSQLASQFAAPGPGMRVIDACAGNGGKSLHLAGLMQNKGKLISLDIAENKLENLQKRSRRAGVSIIETRLINTTKIIKRLHDSADIVLLDVPCSGLGVLKRNPEIKWRLEADDLESLLRTQDDILNRYSRMVKPGGILVYSTCSILPCENRLQIWKFIERQNQQFGLLEERFISPEEGFDGFYMAKLRRKS